MSAPKIYKFIRDAEEAVGGFADQGEGFDDDVVAAVAELFGEVFFGGFAGLFGQGEQFAEAAAEGRADDFFLVGADVGAEFGGFFAELVVGELGVFGFEGVDFGVEVAAFFDVALGGGAEELSHGFADGLPNVHGKIAL